MNLHGRAWVFGDDLNTDVIHAPEFYSHDDERVKRGLFHKYDPGLQARIQPGDLLVAGRNFGCGSSRETSIRSLLLNRIGAVIAIDFARIFFRSATNNGLPCLCLARAEDLARVRTGDPLSVDLERCALVPASGPPIALVPPGSFIRRLWQKGGLLALLDEAGPGELGRRREPA